MSLDRDMRRAVRGIEADMTEFVSALNIKFFTSIIRDTPVGNPDRWNVRYKPTDYVGGRLRGNWQTTMGAPAEGEIERRQAGDSGGATTEAITILDGRIGVFWLSNNLPYAVPIEFDGHSHTQAPDGMVRKNAARLEAIIREAAA